MNNIVKFQCSTSQGDSPFYKVDINEVEELVGRLSQNYIQKGVTDITLHFKGTNPLKIEGFTKVKNEWKLTSTKIQTLQKKTAKDEELKAKKNSFFSKSILSQQEQLKKEKVFPPLNCQKDCDFFESLPDEVIDHMLKKFSAFNEISLFSWTCKRLYHIGHELAQEKYFKKKCSKSLKSEKIPDQLYKEKTINFHLNLKMEVEAFSDDATLKVTQRVLNELPKFKRIKKLTYSGYGEYVSDKRLAERLIFDTIVNSVHLPLKSVDFINVILSKEQIIKLKKNHPNITKLSINKCVIKNSTLKIISTTYPNLKRFTLILQDRGLNNDDLNFISLNCKNLTHFLLISFPTISGEITQRGLRTFLTKYRSLQAFGVTNSDQVTDKVLQILAKNKKLRTIIFFNCPAITDQGIIRLVTRIKTLEIIDLGRTAITDVSLKAISANCPHLTHLFLRGCQGITNQGIQDLMKEIPAHVKLDVRKQKIRTGFLRLAEKISRF